MAPKAERFELRLDEDLLQRIDAWADEEHDRPARAEAVRRLVAIGLASGSRRAVHFTDGEKMLMLMMQDLYHHLDVKGDTDPDFLAKVIYGGHYWAPKWDMQGVFHDHVDNPNDVSYVVDVLDMWSFIEEAVEKFDPSQHASLTAAVSAWAGQFPGFDGNNEAGHLSIARFLTRDMDRFSRFAGRELNSHHPTEERYRRMVAVFTPLRATLVGRRLDVDEVVQLLKA